MRKVFLCSVAIIALLSGCKTDFAVNDTWKEINVVYALMDSKDSVIIVGNSQKDSVTYPFQYFRITKAFLNGTGVSAARAAQTPDSLYNKNWVVTLKEESGNNVISLIPDSGMLDPGQFASKVVLYRTATPFRPNPSSRYTVRVYDPKTGVSSTASTAIVGISLFKAVPVPGALKFFSGQYTNIHWNTGANARFYSITLNIYYSEWHKNQTDTSKKIIPWQLVNSQLTGGLSGNEQDRFDFDGVGFYNTLAQNLIVDHTLLRKINGVEVLIQGGGDDLYTYMQVNTPSLGIVQKKNTYSNITTTYPNGSSANGYGIFSSRSTTKYFKPISGQTLDSIMVNPITRDLGFSR